MSDEKKVLTDLLAESPRISTNISLVYFTGSIDKAIVLDQIIFWTNRSTDEKDGWFHKSFDEWREEITLTKSTLNRIFIHLESINLMKRKTKVIRGVRKLFIKANISEITKQLVLFLPQSSKVELLNKKDTNNCTKDAPKFQSGTLQSSKLELSYIEQNPLSQLKEKDISHTSQNLGCISPETQGVDVYQETYFPMPDDDVKEITFDWLLANNQFQLPSQAISDWLLVRKKKKSLITFTAWNQLNKELLKLKQLNKSPVEMFELAVANGWATLKADWFSDNGGGRASVKSKDYDHQNTDWGNKAKEHFKQKGVIK